MRATLPLFTLADAEAAHAAWGCNCGPAAIAAILRKTLDEVRPAIPDFDTKRFTSPGMMFDALNALDADWTLIKHDIGATEFWPSYGLARIQWEGPWTGLGVPFRARYRYTHWIGVNKLSNDTGVFDVNCLNNGSGWVSLDNWRRQIAPVLAGQYKRSTGAWHVTHAIEVRG